jgi:signal transduction histidine kinase
MTDQLHGSHHLEAVGRLSSGIAHEINTPIQFVGNSATFLESALNDMGRLIAAYRDLVSAASVGPVHPGVIREVRFLEHDVDLEYLLRRIPEAIGRINHGVERVAEIVQAIRTFAHLERRPMQAADLNRTLESALLVVKSSVRRVARLEIELSRLPPVVCHESDIGQVFLNLLVNAVDAVAESGKSSSEGLISVRALQEGRSVLVSVSDNGCGMSDAVRERIFDSFFTTKGPGEGTGQGLSIARHTVERLHAGRLTFDTQLGVGTTFRVELPIDGDGEAA